MNTVTIASIKRKGLRAIEEAVINGPARLLSGNDTDDYVVMSMKQYLDLLGPLDLPANNHFSSQGQAHDQQKSSIPTPQ